MDTGVTVTWQQVGGDGGTIAWLAAAKVSCGRGLPSTSEQVPFALGRGERDCALRGLAHLPGPLAQRLPTRSFCCKRKSPAIPRSPEGAATEQDYSKAANPQDAAVPRTGTHMQVQLQRGSSSFSLLPPPGEDCQLRPKPHVPIAPMALTVSSLVRGLLGQLKVVSIRSIRAGRYGEIFSPARRE